MLQCLPREILTDIMRRTDQAGRLGCLLTSKALHEVCDTPGTWTDVTFRDLDHTAVEFMLKHRCETVRIITDTPDDVSWFLNFLADMGGDDVIVHLTVLVGIVQRVCSDLLAAVSRHRALRHLSLDFEDIENTCEVCFPSSCALARLETMRIVDHSQGAKQLVVWFSDSFSRFVLLHSCHIDVGLSDVAVGVPRMPSMRRLKYSYDAEEGGETYEDCFLEGAVLEELVVDVGADTDMAHLSRQLEKASVNRLVFDLVDSYLPLHWNLSPDVEDLVIQFHNMPAEVNIDFQTLKSSHPRLKSVTARIGAPWILEDPSLLANCRHTVNFRHVASAADWMSYFGKVHFACENPTTRIIISGV